MLFPKLQKRLLKKLRQMFWYSEYYLNYFDALKKNIQLLIHLIDIKSDSKVKFSTKC